jgi:hypothetical protein
VTHERLFRAALWRLEQSVAKDQEFLLVSLRPVVFETPREPCPTFFVCLGDGSLFTDEVKRCPNCGANGDRIVRCSCGR